MKKKLSYYFLSICWLAAPIRLATISHPIQFEPQMLTMRVDAPMDKVEFDDDWEMDYPDASYVDLPLPTQGELLGSDLQLFEPIPKYNTKRLKANPKRMKG